MISVPERVKDALRDGRLLKTYRFNVLDTDGTVDFTIDNDTLVYESVKFDERMCSGDTLKFGLCEGSSLEFQYFDHDNITGRQLQCFIDVQYKDADGELSEHTIPMGFFTVKKCSRQASTGIQKITAYNKLQSDYLDAKANDLIQDIQSDVGDADKITIATVQSMLLSDYEITEKEETVEVHYTPTEITGSPSSPTFKINGSSITYYPAIDNKFMECTNALQNKRFRLAISEYCRKLSESMEELKNAITDNIQNPEAYINSLSESSIQTYFGFYVYFLDGTTGRYYLDGDILRPILTPGPDIIGDVTKLEYLSNVGYIDFYYPYQFRGVSANNERITIWTSDISLDEDDIEIFMMDLDGIEGIEISKTDLADVTLRDIVSANYELHCTFGQLSRTTDLFSGVELNGGGLYPAETLYPANDLYPGGVSETSFRSWYSKLWTDTLGEQSFRNLIITYKGLDVNNVPTDFTIEVVVDPDGTTDYIMDDNWLFRNLIWTQQQIEDYADAMVTKMQSIKWFPFEMWAAGLPYIETGDMMEIIAGDETHTSYILQRQLSGIQSLQDTYINGTLDIF